MDYLCPLWLTGVIIFDLFYQQLKTMSRTEYLDVSTCG